MALFTKPGPLKNPKAKNALQEVMVKRIDANYHLESLLNDQSPKFGKATKPLRWNPKKHMSVYPFDKDVVTSSFQLSSLLSYMCENALSQAMEVSNESTYA